jgi:hypothetical protein
MLLYAAYSGDLLQARREGRETLKMCLTISLTMSLNEYARISRCVVIYTFTSLEIYTTVCAHWEYNRKNSGNPPQDRIKRYL